MGKVRHFLLRYFIEPQPSEIEKRGEPEPPNAILCLCAHDSVQVLAMHIITGRLSQNFEFRSCSLGSRLHFS